MDGPGNRNGFKHFYRSVPLAGPIHQMTAQTSDAYRLDLERGLRLRAWSRCQKRAL